MQARPETVARNIRRLMTAANKRPTDLARECGLSSVRMIIQRGSGRVENLAKIADALGVRMADLFAEQLQPFQTKQARRADKKGPPRRASGGER
jgi:transcriptional regulator with XRE-family HTH domain